MKKKIVSLLTAAIVTASLIVGCGNTAQDSTGGETASASETDAAGETAPAESESEGWGDAQKVTFACWYDEDDMVPIIAAINEKLGGEYVVEYTYIARNDYNNVLGTQLAAGEGPDIVADGTNFPARIKAGNVKEITGAAYLKGINEAGFALCKDGDKIYGIPSYGWFSGVWYNKDIFEQNKVAVPTTFDELVAACDALSANGVQPMGFGLADGDTGVHSLLGYIENNFYEASEEGKSFDEEFAKVSITGVVFSWEGYDLFPCVDGDGVPDNEKMEIVKSMDVKRQIYIFQLDEYSWYAAHSIMEFLNWYHENIDSIEIPEDVAGITMIEPEDGQMWSNTNITQEDIDALGDYDEHCRGGIGDLKKMPDGEIFKMQTFADVLGDEDIKEPYEIASTEY